jgi:hypothetical protein
MKLRVVKHVIVQGNTKKALHFWWKLINLVDHSLCASQNLSVDVRLGLREDGKGH